MTFEREVESKEGNHISIDVNENNVTVAVFEGFKLKELRRYETGLGRAIQGSFANCNISVDLDLFNEGIIEYI